MSESPPSHSDLPLSQQVRRRRSDSIHPPSTTANSSPSSPPVDTSSINDDDNDTSWSKLLIDDLKKCRDGFYAATPDLISHADFFLRGSVGDITIVKNEGKKVELLLSGIFEIDRQLFFMSADGGFLPTNAYNRDFVDTKLTCQLIPVQNDPSFITAQNDFNAIVANVKGLERLIPLKKGESLQSCIRDSAGKPCIRLSHTLFVVCL